MPHPPRTSCPPISDTVILNYVLYPHTYTHAHTLPCPQVKNYFNTEGFERWRKIYGDETAEVNKVQLDIRTVRWGEGGREGGREERGSKLRLCSPCRLLISVFFSWKLTICMVTSEGRDVTNWVTRSSSAELSSRQIYIAVLARDGEIMHRRST